VVIKVTRRARGGHGRISSGKARVAGEGALPKKWEKQRNRTQEKKIERKELQTLVNFELGKKVTERCRHNKTGRKRGGSREEKLIS